MQINAVSNTNFGKSPEAAFAERLANASDAQLRHDARAFALDAVNDKKHRRISNLIWGSLPVAAGIAAAVDAPGRIPKLKMFSKAAASWGVMFAAFGATFAALDAAAKNSKTVRDFERNHPLFTNVLAFIGALGVNNLAQTGVDKLVTKYKGQVFDFLKNKKVDTFIKDNKLVTEAMKQVRKAPSAIREFAKTGLKAGPWILIATSILHWFSHEKAKASATISSYEMLKNAQLKAQEYMVENHIGE